ncbi:type I polyketide synthase [Nocardia mangyaensis]|uniref:type I polyketide synthase n=1 Tax=Nocardia mangyaensis TaxID=2213200 RepID=UPI000A4719C8|nr:type I polyketide synthase [Nocardia mangyaensis]
MSEFTRDIAVVGISCRFPKADGAGEFWELLTSGTEAVGTVPEQRAGLFGGAGASARGGVVDDIDHFDADFFGITTSEADAMDPQQRLALELGWAALEDAGITRAQAGAARLGVFLGATWSDYGEVTRDADELSGYSLTGVHRGMIANRLSRFLGADGPSLVVDTGQSSSLVAVHLACQSLRTGESELAFAGGINVVASAFGSRLLDEWGGLSPDGHCYAFDARANGFVRGEGGGMVLLKPLDRAVADGDRVYCVIRGSAVATGSAGGLTVPSEQAQRQALRLAYADAGIAPHQVQYVELHGTGTPVGDPIEARALNAELCVVRPVDQPLRVGSVKTVIGHLEAAAGIAGLIRTALSLSARRHTPTLHFANPNPDIDMTHLRVTTNSTPWPDPAAGLIAGVSSFGMGGVNCHVVLTGAPVATSAAPAAAAIGSAGAVAAAKPDAAGTAVDRVPAGEPAGTRIVPWVISGRGWSALVGQAGRLADRQGHVADRQGHVAGDIGWSLATTRAVFEARAVVFGTDIAELLTGVRALAAAEVADKVVTGTADPDPGPLVFVFAGQGSQRVGMGAGLAASYPVFAEAFDRVCAQVDPLLEPGARTADGLARRGLRAMVFGADDETATALASTRFAQPAIFAFEVALFRLLESWGVRPDLLVGHSVGEIAAAHVAGVLSLADACALVVARGRLMDELPDGGEMAAVAADEAEIAELLAGYEEVAGLAAVNAPGAVVVSGAAQVVRDIAENLRGRGRRVKQLAVSHAFHSPLMRPMLAPFADVLQDLAFGEPTIPIISTVTGRLVATDLGSPRHWLDHARRPVRFADAMAAAAAEGATTFLELGPDGGLTAMVTECLGDVDAVSIARAGQEETPSFLTALARLFVRGVEVDWRVAFDADVRRVPLPTYVFQRQRYWVGAAATRSATTPREAHRFGDLSGAALTRAVERLVTDSLRRVLGPSADLSADSAFTDLGVDSAAAVELRTLLSQATGVRLPAGLLFDHPKPSSVVTLILSLIGALEPPAAQPENSRQVDTHDDPIVIIGMGCRFPGGVGSAEDLWRVVAEGLDVIADFPTDRGWPTDLHDPDPEAIGKSYARAGGFLDDAGDFDPSFFGISPREALSMEPQQRQLLEVAWETLEDAGIDPSALQGGDLGVYVGVNGQSFDTDDAGAELAGLRITGTAPSVLSGRLAYFLGTVGPAITVDTACSSSLVALHLALGSVRSNECSVALVGGVTVMSTPGTFLEFSRQRGLSADGRCKPFAAAADGTGWSEGVGMLLVERLSRAREHGHRVLAVVRGSAINQDGASNGITAPNGPSQQRVIRAALTSAGLAPADIDVVEAHGTGTRLGDPIEAEALQAAYGRDRQRPLWLGSIKSNIGHTQAAAGMAGLIKMVSAFRHDHLPKTLHVDAPTPHVDWTDGGIELLTEPRDWPSGTRPRRAGISAFGISGTNAHVIIEEPPGESSHQPPSAQRRPHGGLGTGQPEPSMVAASDRRGVLPWVVSARDPGALSAQAHRLAAWPSADPADIGWSLLTTRARFDHRAVVLGADRGELAAGLAALAAGTAAENVTTGAVRAHGGTVFVFAGQGSQWPGMARALMASSAVFRGALEDCDRALADHVDWSLLDILTDPDQAAELDRVDVVQPVLFAVMVSLARVWTSLGVRPDAVIGHSQGEIAAACVAGALTLADAAKVIARRSQALVEISGLGAMVSIPLSRDEVDERLRQLPGNLSVAAVNGPRSVVISGDVDAAVSLLDTLTEAGIRARRIPVDYAAHSDQVARVRARLLADLDGVSASAATIPLWSTVTGEWLDTTRMTADYWYRNLRDTVELEQAVAALAAADFDVFVEVSPHPVLAIGIEDTIDANAGAATVVGSLRRDRGGLDDLLTSAAKLYVHGVPVAWETLFADSGAARVDLPTYAFQHERFWLTPTPTSGDVTAAGLARADHPLLGAAVEMADGTLVLTGRLGLDTHPWLADHAVAGTVLLPGTAFVELAIAAGDRVGCPRIEELTLTAPLLLPAHGATQIQVIATGDATGYLVSVHARTDDNPWTQHATGTVVPASLQTPTADPIRQPADAVDIDVTDVYDRFAAFGYEYGPGFRGLRQLARRGAELFADVRLPEALVPEVNRFLLHPALLDAALHALLPGATTHSPRSGLPFLWTGTTVHATGATQVRVHATPTAQGGTRLRLTDTAGNAVATVDSVLLRDADLGSLRSPDVPPLFGIEWTPVATPESARGSQQWAMLGTGADVVRSYDNAASLAAAVDAGSPVPSAVLVLSRPDPATDLVVDTHRRCRAILDTLAKWLPETRWQQTPLVVITVGATGPAPRDPAGAAVRGLVRTAQTEHPGRVVFIDLDPEVALPQQLSNLPLDSGEPELAVRAGTALAPRLRRTGPAKAGDAGPLFDPSGTVLITGATGTLGGLLARHLVEHHGVRHLLLVSRRGNRAPGAGELRRGLTELGARVTISACDVTDRTAVATLIDSVSTHHPLRAIIHTAGTLDDATVTALTSDQLTRVLAPKVDAAWHLHELTSHLDLTAFVLYSSISGVLGGAGQANYAAGNQFLDALAEHRRALGLPATAMVWGLWAESSGLTGHLAESDVVRMARAGVLPMSSAEAMSLFDRALGDGAAVAVAARLDTRIHERSDTVPALFRALVRGGRRRAATTVDIGDLARRLSSLTPRQRSDEVRDLVARETALVLGYPAGRAVPIESPFSELGFDSLTAIELRNRLGSATGLALTTGLVFDHPTVSSLTEHLLERLVGAADPVGVPVTPTAVAEDPVVIVGMGCRFPGGVDSPEGLWRVVAEGLDVVTDFPTDRGWPADLYDPDPEASGKSYARTGGFLHSAADFDAGFFGISPREATGMDPQQRLLLEVAWETFEDAGIDPVTWKGSDTGVFVGQMYHDYAATDPVPEAVEGTVLTGTAGSVASGRVAYSLGFVGPAVTVDTACSSSLVALHLAVRAVRSGECGAALAGGVTVMSSPRSFVEFSRQRGLAADGRCKSFAAAADGAGWAEGVGLVLVERLSAARRHGHRVLAVVRGTAVNQDGASNGLTAPNGPSQQRVIRQALDAAGLAPAEVDVVEAHGTGTRLGDPIEAEALLATYGRDRAPDRPLWLGSVKSNIGHTQAAAGMAGVIKMVLSMRHHRLPRTLHVDAPSPLVGWSAGAVRLLTESRPWPATDRPRRAGVSSFGISGTNAHVVLEEPADRSSSSPTAEPPLSAATLAAGPGPSAHQLAAMSPGDTAARTDPGSTESPRADTAPTPGAGDASPLPMPWIVSARSETALTGQAQRLAAWPIDHAADIGWSLLTTRSLFDHRAVILGGDIGELRAGVDALAAGAPTSAVITGSVDPHGGGLAFVFAGQGSQRVGMGRELYAAFPVFATTFDGVCAQLDPLVGTSLRDAVFDVSLAGEAVLDRTRLAQPAIFAVEVALYRLLESWGVHPDVLVGHSVGEIAVAHVAGVLTLPDACLLVAARGSLMDDLPGGGAMAAVSADEHEVGLLLAGRESVAGLAAVNAPESVVVSGAVEAIDQITGTLRARGRRVKPLRVSHAFHSPLMEPMLAAFEEVLRRIDFGEPRLPVFSTVTGRLATGGDLRTPEYWLEHVCRPVRFADAVTRAAHEGGSTTFVEVGADGGLSSLISGVLHGDRTTVPILRPPHAEVAGFRTALARLFVRGTPVQWRTAYQGRAARTVTLPTYAFAHQRYWLPQHTPTHSAESRSTGHPLVTEAVDTAQGGALLTGRLALATHPWLADHTVGGLVLVPGTTFVELLCAAGDRIGCDRIDELTLARPLALPAEGTVDIQVAVAEADESGRHAVTVHSRPVGDAAWTAHATGTVSEADQPWPPPVTPVTAWPPPEATEVDLTGAYDHFAEHGYHYGPAFQSLRRTWTHGADILAEVALPEEYLEAAAQFVLHPALFDAVLHALLPGVTDTVAAGSVPFSLTGVRIAATGVAHLRARLVPTATDTVAIHLFDTAGQELAVVDALRVRRSPIPAPAPADGALLTVDWVTARAGAAASARDWAVLGAPAATEIFTARGLGSRVADLASLRDAQTTPPVVLLPASRADTGAVTSAPDGVDSAADTARRCAEALALIRELLTDSAFDRTRIVAVTSGAAGETPTDLGGAAVRGLLRSAQSEHPGRILLVDLDDNTEPEVLTTLLALDEPDLMLRDGTVWVPRLIHAPQPPTGSSTAAVDPFAAGTVLITGGTAGLGSRLARHLVARHGARDLVLVSRRGDRTPGIADLLGELTDLGARVRVLARDVGDSHAVAELVRELPDLRAIVHVAGTVADGLVTSMDRDQLTAVLTPKVAAAWALHKATEDHDLAAFVVFSSVAGILGTPGQANYAAANSFLDALMRSRAARGRPGLALAWGLWDQATGLTGHLDRADRVRLARSGIAAMSTETGLRLFDAALPHRAGVLAAAQWDHSAIPAPVPSLWRKLVRASPRRAAGATTAAPDWRRRTESLAPQRRAAAVRALVESEVNRVLGYSGSEELPLDRALGELGFDSLTAVELRNRLNSQTGLSLPAGVVFDHPTTRALAEHLLEQLTGPPVSDTTETLTRIVELADQLEVLVADGARPELDQEPVLYRLEALLSKLRSAADDDEYRRLAEAPIDDIIDLIDQEEDLR